MPAGRAIIKDQRWQAMKKAAAKMMAKVVKVGVIGAKARGAVEGEDNFTIGNLAGVHEFGAAIQMPWGVLVIPERSFIRAAVAEHRADYAGLMRSLGAKVVEGRLTVEAALGILGATVVGHMQQRISEGLLPVNAPTTIARKGSSVPLIDSGRLRQSITWAVVKAKDAGK